MNQSSYLVGKSFVDIIGLLCCVRAKFRKSLFRKYIYGSLAHEKEMRMSVHSYSDEGGEGGISAKLCDSSRAEPERLMVD